MLARDYLDFSSFSNDFDRIAGDVTKVLGQILYEPMVEVAEIGKVLESKKFLTLVEKFHEYNETFTVKRGGKRIRPYIFIKSYQAVGGENLDAILPASTCVELVHNFTLIHDDIQDKDEIRSDMPTVRKMWSDLFKKEGYKEDLFYEQGDNIAINAGNYLGEIAYDVLLSSNFPENLKNKAAIILTKKVRNITGGQNLDLWFENDQKITTKDYVAMVDLKTGSLFEASSLAGATLGNANEQTQRCLEQWSRLVGRRFQIHDDLIELNIQGVKGKPIGRDIVEGKITFPVIATRELGSKKEIKKLNKALGKRKASTDQIKEAIEAIQDSGAVELCNKEKNQCLENAIPYLKVSELTPSYEHQLYDFSIWVGKRSS